MGSYDSDQDGIPDIAVIVSVPKASDVCRNIQHSESNVNLGVAEIAHYEGPAANFDISLSRTVAILAGSVLHAPVILRC